MSKADLYRVPADQNPSDTEKLPKEPLDFEFPNTEQSPVEFRMGKLLTQLMGASLITIAVPITLHYDLVFFGLLAAYFAFQVVVRCYRSIGPRVAGTVMSAFLVSYFCYLFSIKYNGTLFYTVLLVTLVYTLNNARLFRQHWKHRASCGMLTKQVVENFRKREDLPRGLVPDPIWPSFLAAFRSWATYEPSRSRGLGLMTSPAGTSEARYAKTFAMTILWAGVVVSPYSIAFFGQFFNPFVIIGVLLLIVPVALPLGVMFLASADMVGKAHVLMKHQFEPKNWAPFIRQLQTSPKNKTQNESLYLGRVHGDGSPVLYQAERIMRGGWIQGSPGSGKTLFLMQLVEQLIELGYSVVTLDCKGTSHDLLYGAQAAIERVRKDQGRVVPLYPFTPVHGMPTYLLDLFSQPFWNARSPEEKAGLLLGFFGLSGQQVYGESYYRDTNWTVQQHVTARYPQIKSFYEASQKLYEELRHAPEWELSKAVRKDGEHPGLILRRLGLVDALNMRPTYSQQVLESSLKLESLFQKPTVLHCSLPSISDPVGNPEVGRVILSSILATAANLPHRPIPVVVVCDEFQRMVARSLDVVLQQARSRGVGVILTNQSSADLVAVDPNMPDTIAGNTAMQAWIKATDSFGLRQVQNYGGQYIEHFISRTVSNNDKGTSTSVTRTEQVLDRVSTGLIDRVNSAHDQYFLRLTDDGGYATYGGQMFAAQMGYHTDTPEEYDRRVEAPWPHLLPGMLINGQHRPKSGPPGGELIGRPKPTPAPGGKRKPTPLGQIK